MPDFVLFTYPESVVGRRLEWYLTLRGIRYHVCTVDNKLPRAVLDRLGVHYRRIPILAVGRDIYCDSRCIIDKLEYLYKDVPRLGSDPVAKPYEYGIERILENWAMDGGLFLRTAQLITPDNAQVHDPDWLADRAELTGVKFDAKFLDAMRDDALSHARLHLQMVEDCLLADGRKWLAGGHSASVSDVHVLWIFDWMTRPKEQMGMKHAYPSLLNGTNYPRTFAWIERMNDTVQAAWLETDLRIQISDDEAVQIIEQGDLWEPAVLTIDDEDPSGLRHGDEAELMALDSAPLTSSRRRDVGRLQGLTIKDAAVSATTAQGVEVRIHYQRANVRVQKATGEHRLRASEVAKDSGQ